MAFAWPSSSLLALLIIGGRSRCQDYFVLGIVWVVGGVLAGPIVAAIAVHWRRRSAIEAQVDDELHEPQGGIGGATTAQ
jgi:hypothetical protein